ncbi:hypothetical protein Pla22_39470 [Rubripirellula amarantea]|uniref:Keratin-like protein n=1 Tax=Rubripirellula amarantea TaxID=2527999 RepID=A0A5C5WKI5_9BACT|nr:hypothetical protein Pla22_39470 [Rubripirellula amarantea]
MRRVFIPALLAVAMLAVSSSSASAFGFLDKLCNNDCDTCCDVEPACGCEFAAPTCGCEVVDPCCDSPCGKPKFGLLKKLFAKHNNCCDSGCEIMEPACGCEIMEPACGCEVAAPSCGCEVDPCCDSAPACGSKIKGLFSKLFHKHNNCCDTEPACGCEYIEPACGCEPSCGCGM